MIGKLSSRAGKSWVLRRFHMSAMQASNDTNNPRLGGNVFSILNSIVSDVVLKKRRPVVPLAADSSAQQQSYRVSTAPSGLPLTKMLRVKFPLSLKESFEDYKKRHAVMSVQEELLALLQIEHLSNLEMNVLQVPILMDGDGRVVKLDTFDSKHCSSLDRSNYINEVCIAPKDMDASDKDVKHMVLIHGYGAGLGFFIKNIEQLAVYLNSNKKSKWCIHAIDLLGCGASSRPAINYKTNNSLEAFETWFTDSLESWRIQRQLVRPDNNLVVAHSLGAYLSLCYNIRYPLTFRKLVLVSPAGIIKPLSVVGNKKIPKWFEYLWNKNVSPFSLVRYSGPLGSLFVSGWTSRRFAKLAATEIKLLHKYAYGIFNARGSGEYFLNYVLSAGGVPRHPLVKNKSKLLKISCDTEWLYGENDWMDRRGGQLACNYLTNEKGLKSDVKIFKNCGHHIYLDDIPGFNEYLINQLKAF